MEWEVCQEVYASLPGKKKQNLNTETATSNITGII